MAHSPGWQEPRNFLGACLVESDGEFEKRARKIKGRALVASIILQVLVVTALVLLPLWSKGEDITTRVLVCPTLPPTRGLAHRDPGMRRHIVDHHFQSTTLLQPAHIPEHLATQVPDSTPEPVEPDGILGLPPGSPDGISSNLLGSVVSGPTRVENTAQPPPTPRRIRVGTISPAMLIHRVEPPYPPLARQLRREGKVQLRAVISANGRIQSLELVSGDPLLIRSALDAVGQWRYQPTLLNGEPVEVETYITVIYTLAH